MKSPDPIGLFIRSKLKAREENLSLRKLNTDNTLYDFCSNDYLGFVRSDELHQQLRSTLDAYRNNLSGSTGSRLISGNNAFTEALEQSIAEFHGSAAALIFNSGYDANVGLFSSLPQRGDTIITDELIHASIIDGARLSFANRFSFKHNDLNNLEEKLKVAKGNIFIAVESVYSMDGDSAPLHEIVTMAEKYNAAVIVDEAHATGIFGNKGRGLVHELKLQNRVFARIVTFGKALGCHGAAVLGSAELRSYMINFARSFIYTTSASPFTHISVKTAYDLLKRHDFQSIIKDRINFFKQECGDLYKSFIKSESAIQSLIITGNKESKRLETRMFKQGFNLRAILPPTVPAGKERLRICLHTFNSDEQIKTLVDILKTDQ